MTKWIFTTTAILIQIIFCLFILSLTDGHFHTTQTPIRYFISNIRDYSLPFAFGIAAAVHLALRQSDTWKEWFKQLHIIIIIFILITLPIFYFVGPLGKNQGDLRGCMFPLIWMAAAPLACLYIYLPNFAVRLIFYKWIPKQNSQHPNN